MIGQKMIKSKASCLIGMGKLPRFCLFTGEEGIGKRTMMKWVAAHMTKANVIEYPDCKVDTVRTMIKEAHTITVPTIFIMADIHTMSTQAKNAILKITEEPPNNSYFFMSATSESDVLDTIKSRSVVFALQPYSKVELAEYLQTKPNVQLSAETREFILNVSNTIADVEYMLSIDVAAFREYVSTVFEKIEKVSGPNSFKLSDKLALKDEADKYNLKIFFQAFQYLCLQHMIGVPKDEEERFFLGIEITSEVSSELSITGINKQMLVDNWILSIRKAWLNGHT